MAETCSGCGAAVNTTDITYTPDARVMCPSCAAKMDVVAAQDRARPPWMGFAIAGAVVGAIPWFVSVSSSSSSSVNGHVTSFVYRDWIAVGCGVVAALLGVMAAWMGRRSLIRMQAIVAGIAIVALGGYQVARGFGVFAAGSASHEETTSLTIETPVAPAPPPAPTPTTCDDKTVCFKLGLDLEKTDLKGAVTAWARACERGAGGGCFNAALNGLKLKSAEPAKAAALYQKGCDLDSEISCTNLGLMLLRGDGIEKDTARAMTLFTKGCDGGDPWGCLDFANQVTKSAPKDAFALFRKGCDMEPKDGAAGACAQLGIAYEAGIGTKRDLKQALHYYEQACEQSAAACHALAVSYATGTTGLKKNPAKARELYQKGCDADNLASCTNLGIQELDGVGGPKDLDNAKVLLTRACDGGVASACKELK